MSHIVTIETQIRDREALETACRRLAWPTPTEGEHMLFSGPVRGLGVRLPGWRYPVVAELEAGRLHYDNFEGHWGEPRQLERLLQAYAVEKATLEARRQGHSVQEHSLADGSIRLTIQLVGGAA